MDKTPILRPGDTCWRIEDAEQVRVIVDGADYFRAVKKAMLGAEHSIMLIAWDFDTRIRFEPGGATLDGPDELGPFLAWLTRERPDLDIYLLRWALGVVEAVARGMVPMAVKPIRFIKNFHYAMDSAHPAGATHHSKIVVIDDCLAFCGGIDMTAGRWDTQEHKDEQPLRRLTPNGEPLKPWHDVTTAVSGPVARALGELARERWFRATKERLPPPPARSSPSDELWPDLETSFEQVPIAIARTYPDYGEWAEDREIEALYLDAIASAQRSIYVESQYLASAKIARQLAGRLREVDGPEIVIVLPQSAEGWLRQKAMDGARERLLKFLWANDPQNRLGVYYPVTASGQAIYVHAKVLVIDDQLLRVGSSNLNNRSMGFDTECDLALEAGQCRDPAAIQARIIKMRDELLAEHLDIEPGVFAGAVGDTGGLIAAIEYLRDDGRSLRPFTRQTIADDDSILADNEFADPEAAEGGLVDRLAQGLADLFR